MVVAARPPWPHFPKRLIRLEGERYGEMGIWGCPSGTSCCATTLAQRGRAPRGPATVPLAQAAEEQAARGQRCDLTCSCGRSRGLCMPIRTNLTCCLNSSVALALSSACTLRGDANDARDRSVLCSLTNCRDPHRLSSSKNDTQKRHPVSFLDVASSVSWVPSISTRPNSKELH